MFRSIFRTAIRQIHFVSTNNYNIIKPSTPTHSSLKHYTLSPMDQTTNNNYIPFVFYYPYNINYVAKYGLRDIAGRLKRSLSETLVHFYPFAGRLVSATQVDCNDDGVEFQEVNIKRQLSEILETSDHDEEALDLIFPNGLVWGNLNKNSPLLVVRLANFECGGVSIAVCLSHKLVDAKSFSTFMNSWATKTRQTTNYSNANLSEDHVQDQYSPYFISYPSTSSTDGVHVALEYLLSKKDWVTRRFLFPNSKISKIKEMVANKSGLENTTRVEALTALLYKCATTATTEVSGLFTPTVLPQPVNMRHKMLPPLPETSIGNIYWPMYISITTESENTLDVIVEKLKKAKMEMGNMKSLDPMVNLSTLMEFTQNEYKIFWFSSLCRMLFYQVDFGWGNPSRVNLADTMISNTLVLMDTPNGDGIEVLVSLDEQNMAAFQDDEDILAFSSSSSSPSSISELRIVAAH